jgi:hypothetical protein
MIYDGLWQLITAQIRLKHKPENPGLEAAETRVSGLKKGRVPRVFGFGETRVSSPNS